MLRMGYAKHPHAKFLPVTPNLVLTVGFVLTSVILKAMDAGNALSVSFPWMQPHLTCQILCYLHGNG